MITNPILKGFCPDPSIIRVGEDYYVATSTFEWWPGVRLFHSRDLKHWEELPSPLRRYDQLDMTGNPPSGGIWAPCLSYDGKKFYLVYTDVKSKKGMFYNTHNYVVTAEDVCGEWSAPVYLNSIGFDPSLFHDMDGRKYLVNMLFKFKGILVQEVDPVTFAPIGEQKMVYGGSGLRCTEGPHMYHIGDWYYIIVAEGGTGYEHCVTMARSKSIWGPFETASDNPILTSDREDPSALQKCGHADIVETQNGEWYLVHLCSRPVGGQKWCTLGRETAIQKMVWDKDGWLRLKGGGRFARLETEEPSFLGKDTEEGDGYGQEVLVEEGFFCDHFTEKVLSPHYSSPRRSYEEFAQVDAKRGVLLLRGQEYMKSNHRVSLLAVRQQLACCTAETRVAFEPESFLRMAGLSYMYDSLNFFLLGVTATDDGEKVVTLLRCDRGNDEEAAEAVVIPKGRAVSLRAVVGDEGRTVRFFYRVEEGMDTLAGHGKEADKDALADSGKEAGMDDDGWTQMGDGYSTEILTDEYCRGFTGAHFGMYVHDMVRMEQCAEFSYFLVRA